MSVAQSIGNGLFAAAGMFWEIFWALVLGFALSGIVMAFVPKRRITQALGRARPREIGLAMLLGAISSSCSYSAASMTKSLFKKGAHIIPALAFLLASTNLVIELSVVLWILMGWQFVLAEFLGGFVLVATMSILFSAFAPLEEFSKKGRELSNAESAHENAHEHAHDGSEEDAPADPRTRAGWESAARSFVMEWKMIGKDILLGVLISGFLMALVPNSFWQSLFLTSEGALKSNPPFWQVLENAFVGPLVSVASFVCSVGNIPLANVLYHRGISFGGAISFIYADLIIIPLILVYRRYWGPRLALWMTGIFYVSMVITGIVVDLVFGVLGWIPERHSMVDMKEMHFFEVNYTFWLNLVFAGLGAGLYWLSRASESKGQDGPCCHSE